MTQLSTASIKLDPDLAMVCGLQMSGRSKKKKARASLRSLLALSIIIFVLYPLIVLNYYYLSSKKMSHHDHDMMFPEEHSNEKKMKQVLRTRTRNTDVIVYLAQFGGNHSSYGAQYTLAGDGDPKKHKVAITGLYRLNKSLELLYTNYVNDFPTVDVIVFYDHMHPPDESAIKALQCCNRKDTLQFRSLGETWWSLPYGLKSWQHMFWSRPAFSVGYRLMMRWYAVLIWRYLDGEGYTHVMRLDDDSYILSRISYNVFDYMRDKNVRYGFRMPVRESDDNFDKLIDRYLKDHGKDISQKLIDLYNKDRGVGFYNNFFVADVNFFVSPPASTLLEIIDESKLIFEKRTGDLVIQSAVVRLLLDPSEVHWFNDFTYEHMTICRREKCGPIIPKGCPQNGGVARGVSHFATDIEWRTYATKEVRDRFKDNPKHCSVPINQYFVGAEDVRSCSRLQSPSCGFYLKLLQGVNDVKENPSWLQNVTLHAMALNKIL